MSDAIDVAVVGATGVVGEAMLDILAERNYPVGEVHALASERSVGKTAMFGNKPLAVSDLAEFDFANCKVALFSAGASVSDEHAPRAVAAGCVVVDNTSRFRYDDDIPLVVPEVNPEKIAEHKGIIANPNCSTIQMVVALKPIYDAVGITRINVATYQSVSGAGRSAVKELARQTAALLKQRVRPRAGAVGVPVVLRWQSAFGKDFPGAVITSVNRVERAFRVGVSSGSDHPGGTRHLVKVFRIGGTAHELHGTSWITSWVTIRLTGLGAESVRAEWGQREVHVEWGQRQSQGQDQS